MLLNCLQGRFARLVCLLTLITFSVQVTGCSLFASGRQTISVASEPSGADVTINGERAGRTPLQYSIPRKDEASILLSKDGYEPATRHTSRSLSGVGIVDVIFGCFLLVPLFGLMGGGAYVQEPANMAVTLSPVESAAATK